MSYADWYGKKFSEIVKLDDKELVVRYGNYCMIVGNCKASSRRKPSELMVDAEKTIKNYEAEIMRRIRGGRKVHGKVICDKSQTYVVLNDDIYVYVEYRVEDRRRKYYWEVRKNGEDSVIICGVTVPNPRIPCLNAILFDIRKKLMEMLSIVEDYAGKGRSGI